jgi:glycosyltransferase involved in cell wall biosynthesis
VLVPPADPPALADAILQLLADEELRSAMGTAARRRAVELFSWDAIARKTLSLYRELRRGAYVDASLAQPERHQRVGA